MYLETDLFDVDGRINELREELIQISEETGFNSLETLWCSLELDQLIILKIRNSIKKIKYSVSRPY